MDYKVIILAMDEARISRRLQNLLKDEQKAFRAFVKELRDDLKPAVTEDELIEMLAQHLITRPVFAALFENPAEENEYPIGGDQDPADPDPDYSDSDQDLPDPDPDLADIDQYSAKADQQSPEAGRRRPDCDHPREDARFSARNPVSQGMQKVLALLLTGLFSALGKYPISLPAARTSPELLSEKAPMPV